MNFDTKKLNILNILIILIILFSLSCNTTNKNLSSISNLNDKTVNIGFEKLPEFKWSFEVFFIGKGDNKIHSRLINYPIFFRDMVIFATSGESRSRGIKSHVYALNSNTGKEIWEYEVEGSVSTKLLFYNEKIYFGNTFGTTKDYWKDYEFNLYAVDAKTGKLALKFSTNIPVSASPIIYKDTLYFGTHTHKYSRINENDSLKNDDFAFLYALNPETMKIKWRQKVEGRIIDPIIAFNGFIYVRTGDFLRENFLYSLNAMNGKLKWIHEFKKVDELSGALLYDDSTLYTGSFGIPDGYLFAINMKDGKLKWSIKMRDDCWLLPEIYNDILIVGTSECYLYGINKGNGEVKWKFKIEGGIELERIGTLDGNILYVGSYYIPYPPISQSAKDKNWNIYAIDIKTGKEIWEYEVDGSVSSIPLIYGNIVLFGNENLEKEYKCNYLYALDKITGKVIWKWSIPNKDYITSIFPIIIRNNTLFFGTINGFLYALSEQKMTSKLFQPSGIRFISRNMEEYEV